MKERNHGFTLIEIMVVVAILGILAATSVPSYRIYLNQAQLLAAEITIKQAIRDYSVDKDYSPAMMEDLVTGGYLKAIPNDPWTRIGSSQVASNTVTPSLAPPAIAASATLGIEEAGDWFFNNDGQTVTFYAKTHPGRVYNFPSFGLPTMGTPTTTPSQPSSGGATTPPSSQGGASSGSQQGGSQRDRQSNKKSDKKNKDSKNRRDKNRRD